jgi:uncharacterized integral membrane protein (TIGR00697 family)
MPNELLWIAFLLLDLSVVLAMWRLFGKTGLYVVIAYSIILANVQVLKFVDLFGLTTTLGNVLYASIFLSTDILSEVQGKREARRGVIIGFVVMVIMVVYMRLGLLFTPAPVDESQGALQLIFGPQWQIAAASLSAYAVSQMHDVWMFHLLKAKTQGGRLWLRNNVSTALSQLLDTAVFTGLAVALGVFPPETAWEIFLTAYVMKLMVAVVDTPFIYLARKWGPRET